MLVTLGRLTPNGTPESWLSELIEKSGVVVRDLTPAIAVLSTQFPESFPHDPADRLIAATARAEGIALLTRDEKIQASPLVKTLW
jgi:PIN domain nuclease of toxin-antitoxin system